MKIDGDTCVVQWKYAAFDPSFDKQEECPRWNICYSHSLMFAHNGRFIESWFGIDISDRLKGASVLSVSA